VLAPVQLLRGLARNVRDVLKVGSSTRAKLAYLRQKAVAELNPWRFSRGLEKAFPSFTEQTSLINSPGAWDVLIVLDACRHDVFENVVHDLLDGSLARVRSPASMTIPWLKRTWHGTYRGVTYVSAHPYVNSMTPMGSFDARGKFSAVIDVWRNGFDFSYGTTPPWNVNKAVKRLLLSLRARRVVRRRPGAKRRPKLVIHYVQPHFPYIGVEDVRRIARVMRVLKERLSVRSLELGHLVNIYLIDKLDGGLENLARFLRRSYEETLRLVLEHVALLLEDLRGRVVITADHGELLGEHGLFFHLPLPLPELRHVPWFVVR